MHILPEYRFLLDDALWIIVDPWINQPLKDQKYYAELDIDINQHNHIFIDKLFHELEDVRRGKPAHEHNNMVIFQEASQQVHPLFDDPKYPVYKNIDDLYTRSKAYTDIVFCGLHYGMCVHSALKRLSTAYPKCNYYVKRDMCCPMPLHSLDQYDSDVKYEGAKII